MDKNLIFTITQGTLPEYYQKNWQKEFQLFFLRIWKKTNLIFDQLDGLIIEGAQDLITLEKDLAKLSGENNNKKELFLCSDWNKINQTTNASLTVGAPEPQNDFWKFPADLFIFSRVEPWQKEKMIERGYGEIYLLGEKGLEVKFFLHKKYWKERFRPEQGGIQRKFLDKKILDKIVQRLWGFNELKKAQFSVIKKVFQNRKVLGILPTGGGKSICFQLPALLFPGTSIVVSPLKALIHDQVNSLIKLRKGFCVDFLDSSQDFPTKKRVFNRWEKGDLKIIYLSPERLQQGRIRDFIEKRNIKSQGFFIIDEIHCVSEWGHDFRPSYLQIANLPVKQKNSGFIGLTATAPSRVRKELKDRFNLKSRDLVETANIDRPEIGLKIKIISDGENRFSILEKILKEEIPIFFGDKKEFIQGKKIGVIFTPYARAKGLNTRQASTEWLKVQLEEKGYGVFSYHGGLGEKEKIKTQEKFLKNKAPILVATRAFGMGIDKPDINFVIHYYSPGSLEAYFQELGRGGRNGERTLSVLLYKPRKDKCKNGLKKTGKLETNCSGNWKCSYGGESLCDFGIQANFIESHHIRPEKHRTNLDYYLNEISRRQGRKISFLLAEKKQVFFQKYLLFLQEKEIIKDFFIQSFADKALEIRVVKGINVTNESRENVIFDFIQQDYRIRRRKYAALSMLEKYVLEKEICRRSILLNYMGQAVEPGARCGFCDRETLKSPAAVSIQALDFEKTEKNKIVDFFKAKEFQGEEFEEIIELAEKNGGLEELARQVEEKLKIEPFNPIALFVRGLIQLKKNLKSNDLKKCILELQKRGDHSGVRDVLCQIIINNEEFAIRLIEQIPKRQNFASCGFLIKNEERKKRFNLLCMQSWAEELLVKIGGEKVG